MVAFSFLFKHSDQDGFRVIHCPYVGDRHEERISVIASMCLGSATSHVVMTT